MKRTIGQPKLPMSFMKSEYPAFDLQPGFNMYSSVKTRYFDDKLLRLSAAMTGQSVIKHFLTEGDKFIVSRLSPLADQGGYAVASNYGSSISCASADDISFHLRFARGTSYLPAY